MNFCTPFPQSKTALGRALGEVLAGSWRRHLSEDIIFSTELLSRLAAPLTSSGAASLAWFRICRSQSHIPSHILRHYREAHIASVVAAARHESELERLLRAFEDADIRVILLKGWPVARLYPQSGLRPSGDIDLWVNPRQRDRGEALLRDLSIVHAVDLEHNQLRRFEDREFEQFYASCETVRLGSAEVKVLRQEEQIRILCLHFLKHGGWRPIWLCDIALLLESGHEKFDWDLCLGKNPRRARWIGCTVALAHELLEARIPDAAPHGVTAPAPKWLVRTVLREWSDPQPPRTPALRFLLRALRVRPSSLHAIVRGRRRNPIQATVDCNGTFNALPRWPYQIIDVASRTIHFWQGSVLSRTMI